MLGPHMAGLHLGLNLPQTPRRTPGGLLMAEPSRIWTPDDIAWSPTSFASGHNERDEILGPMSGKYCADLRQVVRRKTRTVTAGPVSFGSDHPIVRQTMGTAAVVKRPWSLSPRARLVARGGSTRWQWGEPEALSAQPQGASCRPPPTAGPPTPPLCEQPLSMRQGERRAMRPPRQELLLSKSPHTVALASPPDLPPGPGTTSTKDVRGTVEQVMRCADEGFDLVRITVVGAPPE